MTYHRAFGRLPVRSRASIRLTIGSILSLLHQVLNIIVAATRACVYHLEVRSISVALLPVRCIMPFLLFFYHRVGSISTSNVLHGFLFFLALPLELLFLSCNLLLMLDAFIDDNIVIPWSGIRIQTATFHVRTCAGATKKLWQVFLINML